MPTRNILYPISNLQGRFITWYLEIMLSLMIILKMTLKKRQFNKSKTKKLESFRFIQTIKLIVRAEQI